jgi:hypothetical protein
MYAAPLDQGGQAVSAKGWRLNIFSFVGHTVFVITMHLCHHCTNAVMDNLQMNGCDCVLIKLYL